MSDTRDSNQRPAANTGDLRDTAIEARYRAASNEMPSAAADAAILAQARAAARVAGGAANDASWSKRLRAPLALAACAVLAVGIVTRISVEAPEALRGETPVAANSERTAPAAPVEATTAQMRSPAASPADASTSLPNSAPASAPTSAPERTPPSAAATAPSSAPAVDAASSRAQQTGANGLVKQPAPVQEALPAQERKLREEASADAAAPSMRERPALAKAAAPAAAAEAVAAPVTAPVVVPALTAVPAEARRAPAVAQRASDAARDAAPAVVTTPAPAPAPAAAFPATPYASAPAPAAKPAARTLQSGATGGAISGTTRDAAGGVGSSAENERRHPIGQRRQCCRPCRNAKRCSRRNAAQERDGGATLCRARGGVAPRALARLPHRLAPQWTACGGRREPGALSCALSRSHRAGRRTRAVAVSR